MAKRMFLNQLNTRDVKACVEFYKKLGFVEDPGFEQKEGAPVQSGHRLRGQDGRRRGRRRR